MLSETDASKDKKKAAAHKHQLREPNSNIA